MIFLLTAGVVLLLLLALLCLTVHRCLFGDYDRHDLPSPWLTRVPLESEARSFCFMQCAARAVAACTLIIGGTYLILEIYSRI